MMTVKEVSCLTGVSIRTLQYYDRIGLLKASAHTEAGYRLYDQEALARLQQILLFRELEFPLKEIGEILSRPDFDWEKALAQQIELLRLKKERLENLITFACGIQQTGENTMDFKAFDKEKQKKYAAEVKARWGGTEACAEFETKSKNRSEDTETALGKGLMSIFAGFGQIKTLGADSPAAQSLVRKLQSYITANYYSCTNQILKGLGVMYAAGGEFTENIDAVGGEGTARFVSDAIEIYCR